MLSFFGALLEAFLQGLATPLGAVCVLPLFPGFLSFLSNSLGPNAGRRKLALLGFTVAAGVISFMMLVGIIFTTLLQQSLTTVVDTVSPLAFGLLAIISVMLILNMDFSRFFPHITAPVRKNPYVSAFLFGFFFGAIVLPCNPGFIAYVFARSLVIMSATLNFLRFLMFGLGMAFPLLIFSFLSTGASQKVIGWLTGHKRQINLFAGVFMLVVSLYYLFAVFRIHEGIL